MTSSHILIIDDEVHIRLFLQELLTREGHTVISHDNGPSALQAIAAQEFDLVLLDLQLEQMSGIDILTVLRQRWPETVVIILTGHGSMETAVSALRQGAHDYLFKPCKAVEIRESVRRGLQKRAEMQAQQVAATSPEPASVTTSPASEAENGRFLRVGALLIDVTRHIITCHGNLLTLSPTEFDLLIYLLRQAPRIVPAQELVEKVQGYECDPDEASDIVRYHIYRLRRKLKEAGGATDLIRTVRGVGYTIDKQS